MIHPARTMSFAELHDGLMQAVDASRPGSAAFFNLETETRELPPRLAGQLPSAEDKAWERKRG